MGPGVVFNGEWEFVKKHFMKQSKWTVYIFRKKKKSLEDFLNPAAAVSSLRITFLGNYSGPWVPAEGPSQVPPPTYCTHCSGGCLVWSSQALASWLQGNSNYKLREFLLRLIRNNS